MLFPKRCTLAQRLAKVPFGRPLAEHLRAARDVSDQYGVKDAACPISTG